MTDLDNNNINETNDALDTSNENTFEEPAASASAAENGATAESNEQEAAPEAPNQQPAESGSAQSGEPMTGNPYAQQSSPTMPYQSQNQTPPRDGYSPQQNGYYQQTPYYGSPYQQQYNPSQAQQAYRPMQPQQGYNQQPSMGYYRTDTNEYIYSPNPPKKKGGAGKAAIIVIVSLLCIFVVSIMFYSAYSFVTDGSSMNSDGLYNRHETNDELDGRWRPSDGKNDKEDKNNTFTDDDTEKINEGAAPAVGELTAIRDFPTIEQLAAPDDAMPLPDIYDKVSKSVVGISCPVKNGTQTGTGFIISEDGYVVTNAHVIDGATSIMIVDGELNEYNAEVIGSDTQTDIAVLRINPDEIDLAPVEFGKSGELRIGELTVAIGNPLGFDLYGTMTTGIVSGLDRSVTIGDYNMNLLQTSASINHGNSGGPLIDAYGRVIGITSAKIDSTYGEGLGFAIPIDEAVPIIESLIRYGYVPGRPAIGISGQDIDDMISLFYNMPKGFYVMKVVEGSGADKAGIRTGDIIIGIEGETVKTMEELNAVKNNFAVGDTVTLTIYRGGQNFDVDVTLTESTPDK